MARLLWLSGCDTRKEFRSGAKAGPRGVLWALRVHGGGLLEVLGVGVLGAALPQGRVIASEVTPEVQRVPRTSVRVRNRSSK